MPLNIEHTNTQSDSAQMLILFEKKKKREENDEDVSPMVKKKE